MLWCKANKILALEDTSLVLHLLLLFTCRRIISKGNNHKDGADILYQGHVAPEYILDLLEGRFTTENLDNFNKK